MSEPDLRALLAKAQEMQKRMGELQQELGTRTVEGEAGGGMVRAVVTGGMRVVELQIEPTLLEGGDRAMLQDLIAAAVNAALEKAQRMVQEELQRAAGGGLPGFGGPGGPGGLGGPATG